MKLSILGIYNYDNAIFDNLEVPEGLDKQEVVDEILMQCAELEILYADLDIMKRAIKIWSSGNKIKWEKLYKTLTVEYNPIWNVDADITETGSGSRDIDRDITGSDIRSVKGFNDTKWAEAEKHDVNNNENVGETTSDTRQIRRTGNIGVTTTQQMLQAEREIADFNMIDVIVQSFKYRFCILIY